MANRTQIEDSEIVQALIESRTRKEASEMLGMSMRQLYERMRSAELQAMLADSRAAALRRRMEAIESAQNKAILTCVQIMDSKESSNQDKLRAAGIILEAGKTARAETVAFEISAAKQLRSAEAEDRQASMLDALSFLSLQ